MKNIYLHTCIYNNIYFSNFFYFEDINESYELMYIWILDTSMQRLLYIWCVGNYQQSKNKHYNIAEVSTTNRVQWQNWRWTTHYHRHLWHLSLKLLVIWKVCMVWYLMRYYLLDLIFFLKTFCWHNLKHLFKLMEWVLFEILNVWLQNYWVNQGIKEW